MIVGGALVVPAGLLARLKGERKEQASLFAMETKRVEQLAMAAVMDLESSLGNEPRDVSSEKCGWDVESRVKRSESLRFIEVKGRLKGSDTVTVTKNEILASFNKPEQFILAVVLVPPSEQAPSADPFRIGEPATNYESLGELDVFYVKKPFDREPGFAEVSINFNLNQLISTGEKVR